MPNLDLENLQSIKKLLVIRQFAQNAYRRTGLDQGVLKPLEDAVNTIDNKYSEEMKPVAYFYWKQMNEKQDKILNKPHDTTEKLLDLVQELVKLDNTIRHTMVALGKDELKDAIDPTPLLRWDEEELITRTGCVIAISEVQSGRAEKQDEPDTQFYMAAINYYIERYVHKD